jgi:small membrane protein
MFWLIPKLLAVVLAIIVVSKSYIDFRSRVESLQLFLFWAFMWALIVTTALFPNIVDVVIGYFGRGTGVGTFLGMAVVLLFFLVYRIYAKLERLEHILTKAIQETALREPWDS